MTPSDFFVWLLVVTAGDLFALLIVGFAAWMYLNIREHLWAQREVEATAEQGEATDFPIQLPAKRMGRAS